jgi:hypothetical protein
MVIRQLKVRPGQHPGKRTIHKSGTSDLLLPPCMSLGHHVLLAPQLPTEEERGGGAKANGGAE